MQQITTQKTCNCNCIYSNIKPPISHSRDRYREEAKPSRESPKQGFKEAASQIPQANWYLTYQNVNGLLKEAKNVCLIEAGGVMCAAPQNVQVVILGRAPQQLASQLQAVWLLIQQNPTFRAHF